MLFNAVTTKKDIKNVYVIKIMKIKVNLSLKTCCFLL